MVERLLHCCVDENAMATPEFERFCAGANQSQDRAPPANNASKYQTAARELSTRA
jgi:hypothetical protein